MDLECSTQFEGRDIRRVHLCRHAPCQCAEVGYHAAAYRVVDRDVLQPAPASEGMPTPPIGQQARKGWCWVLSLLGSCCCRRRARVESEAAPGAPRVESESEPEETGLCEAGLIEWNQRGELIRLTCRPPCEERSMAIETELLSEDAIGGRAGRTQAHLCAVHSNQYMTRRRSQKCAVSECMRLGTCRVGPA
eukprot:261181-Amphidinium_carterae.1